MSVCSPNYGADGNFPYRWCIVPECESSSVNTPEKLWIESPTDPDTRTTWLNLAYGDSKKLPISKSQMYFCEDHFNLENDMENYEEYKSMGSVDRVRMKLNCVPTILNCQKDRIKSTANHQQPQFLGYSENITKNSNKRLNYRSSNFSMDIQDANRKKKHTIRIKPNIRNDRLHDIEKNEAKNKTKKDPTPTSSEKKDRQTKFIIEAFKIINSNQNSESINFLLANSLQNLSSTLLSALINPNFNLVSQFDTKLPADINISGNKSLSSNITTTYTEKNTYINEYKAFIADTTNVDVTPAISTENITDLKENAFQGDSIDVENANVKDTENNTNNLEEVVFKAESSNLSTLAISTENLINILEEIASKAESSNKTINSSSPTENITKKKTEKKSPGSYSINDYTINFTNSTMSIEELTNIIKKDERIACDTFGFDDDDGGLDENIAGEELKQPVAEKEDSIAVEPEKQESVGGDESYGQPVGTPIALDRPILGENIKQLTLTREQLMEEREKIAGSQAYLRAPHKCESCIIGFEFYENLTDHFKRKHTRIQSLKRREIICDVCRQFIERRATYNMHMFYHLTRYQCVLCEQLFATYDKAALHYKRQHWEMRYRTKEAVSFKSPRCPYKTGYCTEPEAPPEPKRAKPTPDSTATGTPED